MTRNSRRQLLCLILIVLTFTGCNKVADFFRSSKDGDIKYCNIKKIKFLYAGNPKVATFTYNSHGYPVSAIMNEPTTGLPHRYFYYDKKDRLVKQVGNYGNGFFQFYAKYRHDAKGRIVSDTTWAEGTFTPAGEVATYITYTTGEYVYDKYDRIIRYLEKLHNIPPSSPRLVWSYEYNEDGNLIGEGLGAELKQAPWVYDNKINPNRTNKIWMFVNRDYSVNNSFVADSYNQNKLPLKISYGERSSGPYRFFQVGMGNSEFEYMCK